MVAIELEYLGVAVLIKVQGTRCRSPARTARKGASKTGGRMSSALNLEMREVERALGAANAAVTREEWAEAERALAEVQDRVGRLLREVGLKQASVPIVEPPSPIKGD